MLRENLTEYWWIYERKRRAQKIILKRDWNDKRREFSQNLKLTKRAHSYSKGAWWKYWAEIERERKRIRI
jgi:hypothetical protein